MLVSLFPGKARRGRGSEIPSPRRLLHRRRNCRDAPSYNLTEREFIAELRRMNGTPQEVLEHPELMGIMIPMLRADFQLIQTYEYNAESPLSCPITALCGSEDNDENCALMSPWKQQTSSTFVLHNLPGGHFFLRSSKAQLLEALTAD